MLRLDTYQRNFYGFLVFYVVLIEALYTSSCSSKIPPNLTPEAKTAWYGTQVIHVSDIIRDTAVDGNKINPPIFSTETTRKIVLWHQSALQVIRQAPAGWANTVSTGILEVVRNLPDKEKATIQPYVDLLMAVIREVT